jgi:hypothetical protein
VLHYTLIPFGVWVRFLLPHFRHSFFELHDRILAVRSFCSSCGGIPISWGVGVAFPFYEGVWILILQGCVVALGGVVNVAFNFYECVYSNLVSVWHSNFMTWVILLLACDIPILWGCTVCHTLTRRNAQCWNETHSHKIGIPHPSQDWNATPPQDWNLCGIHLVRMCDIHLVRFVASQSMWMGLMTSLTR